MRSLLLVGLLAVTALTGCVAPDAPGAGWQHEEATGVSWRRVSETEMAAPAFEGYPIAYVFRVPGVLQALQAEERVTVPVRVHEGFLATAVSYDGDLLTGARRLTSPYGDGFLNDAGVLHLDLRDDGWTHRVTTADPELELADDVVRTDLVNRLETPCLEYSEPSGNASAACLRHAPL